MTNKQTPSPGLPGTLLHRLLLAVGLLCFASPGSLAGDTPEEVAEQLQSSAESAVSDPNQPADSTAINAVDPAPIPPAETGSSLDELTRDQDRLDIQSYRNVIADIEKNEGAYSPNVAEHLMSLGSALQQSGEHAEAIAMFKRGVHLSRINDGLYGAEQIPLLQSEIRSHIALGDFAAADERQVYLYRVQLRSLSSGPRRANALMQQAGWQQQAYEMRLGEHGFNRLMNMWDLYRLALNDIIKREGENSPSLLSPLYGMLRAQYLISDYQSESSSGFGSEYDFAERQGQSRFNAYRAQSYKKGLSVIRAIQDIETTLQPDNAAVTANTYLQLADWMMWHGQDDEALDNYRKAFAELAASNDAQALERELFGVPVALPALEGVEALPPTVATEQGNALLEFSVTENGRLVDLERIDDNDDNDAKVNRLMRQLRKTQFRPRFEAGEPVATNDIVWAYDSNNW